MSFRIIGLDPAPFRHLHALSEGALAEQAGARRVRVEARHVAPCRVSLEDAEIGESVLLLNFQHQPAATPYRQQGPVFIREAGRRFDAVGVIPPALSRRTLSLRAFDHEHMMVDADLVDGADAPSLIARLFAAASVSYIHAHYARRGCFAALIERG